MRTRVSDEVINLGRAVFTSTPKMMITPPRRVVNDSLRGILGPIKGDRSEGGRSRKASKTGGKRSLLALGAEETIIVASEALSGRATSGHKPGL